MPDYLVEWKIDIEADTPEEAAELARQIQCDPESVAVFFEALDKEANTRHCVDLETGVTYEKQN